MALPSTANQMGNHVRPLAPAEHPLGKLELPALHDARTRRRPSLAYELISNELLLDGRRG